VFDNPDPRKIDFGPPVEIILPARSVLGAIDLDPYSTPKINRVVTAARIYNRDKLTMDEIVSRPWESKGQKRVFVGPPTGAGATRRLLNKLLREYRAGRVSHAIAWIGHNESIIRMPWLWDFPICIPFRRLRPCYYDDEIDEFRNVSPSDWTAVLYLPPADDAYAFHAGMSKFHVSFAPIGRIVFNQYSGEDDWLEAYEVAMRKPFSYHS
jgi:hypothetical protein